MIGELFPNCVTETVGEGGGTTLSVDFDALRQELSDCIVEGPKERYQFTWPDKSKAKLLANTPTTMTLRPCREESVDFDNTKNLYIEGDNLEVLKVLHETYLGKIKMIYIDPPYNTGMDFIYSDNFEMSLDEYRVVGENYDETGLRLVRNLESEGRIHTNWLNMMYPRLKLAKDLLSEEGLLFISIDDREVSNLMKICDEIFGGVNFVSNIVWQSRTSISNDYEVSTNHNHTLIYSKSRVKLLFGGEKLDSSKYVNPDNDPRGPYILVPLDANHAGGNTVYPIRNPKTEKDYYPPNGRIWCYNENTMKELMKDGRIKFGLSDDSAPKKKLYLNERLEKGDVKTPSSLLLDAGTTKDGTEEIMSIFDGLKVFDYPKPSTFIKRLIQYGAVKENDYVLDFFAGSGTTASAAINYQVENELNLHWILVQLPVDLDDSLTTASSSERGSIERAIQYLDNHNLPHKMSELGKQRIRKIGNGIKYNTLIRKIDVGFRVFKLDSSNLKNVFYNPSDTFYFTLDDYTDNIKPDRSPEDLLIQVMLEIGVELSASIKIEESDSSKVFDVDEGYLIACFDDSISEELITAMVKRDIKPAHIVFRDSSMKDDAMLSNIEQIVNTYSPGTKIRIL